MHAIHSGCILSDHFPLFFSIKADFTPVQNSQSLSPNPLRRANWWRMTPSCIEKYCSIVSVHIPTLPSEVLECSSPSCTAHRSVLDTYGSHLISTLLTCYVMWNSLRMMSWMLSLILIAANQTGMGYFLRT